MLIRLQRDRPVTFVKGVRRFGATAIHSEPLHEMISIDLKHIINKPSFARLGGRCEAAVCALRLAIDA
jgi:hypothetical protein